MWGLLRLHCEATGQWNSSKCSRHPIALSATYFIFSDFVALVVTIFISRVVTSALAVVVVGHFRCCGEDCRKSTFRDKQVACSTSSARSDQQKIMKSEVTGCRHFKLSKGNGHQPPALKPNQLGNRSDVKFGLNMSGQFYRWVTRDSDSDLRSRLYRRMRTVDGRLGLLQRRVSGPSAQAL